MAIKKVLFDAFGTLLVPKSPVYEQYVRYENGRDASADRLCRFSWLEQCRTSWSCMPPS